MKADELLEAIGETDPEYARDAHEKRPASRRRAVLGILAGAAAAAALAAVLLGAGPGAAPVSDGLTTERVASLEELEKLYDGPLLAKALTLAGAEFSDIELSHARDVDISDTSGWRSLSFTAERGEEKLEMTCTFDAPEDLRLPGEPDSSVEYGGVTVWLYFGPWDTGTVLMDNACRAVFIQDGILYDMAFLCNDEDDMRVVRKYLDLLLAEDDAGTQLPGEVEDALHPLESLMGFTDYRVTVEGDFLGSTWHFWLDLGGGEMCVAEAFGIEGLFGAYSVDLDGDGTPEVVTNNVYGDGGTLVRVFRYADGVFYVGEIDRSFYEELGFEELDGVGSVEERYDPERGVFTVTNLPGSEGEREITFSGPEHLRFRRYQSSGTDHFDTCPLTYDEMEHTDARPVDSVFGYADYRIGIERVEDDGFWRPYDVWHIWVEIDGTLTCVADIRDLSEKTSRLYSADVDGDGVPELIAVRYDEIAVYRRRDGVTEELEPSWEFMNDLRSRVPEGVLRGSYDPEQNAFVYTVEDYQEHPEILYTETVTGLDFMNAAVNVHQRCRAPEYITVPAAGTGG